MTDLCRSAGDLFESAQAGGEDGQVSILVAHDGTLHMLPAGDWSLESLRVHHGARAAYSVTRTGSSLRLEAAAPGETCLLESSRPGSRRRPQPDFPRYCLAAGAAACLPESAPTGVSLRPYPTLARYA